ncbi:membrane protease YdiL (CAAX protease family) [Natranaerovirga hydrolytica]|uniref:Membrane protease YdiL (CAAX protease family) n=1 Tax=Natranaerovirga hydrolytica TaxID=680378 RepID=A0A4R1MMQ1_9FIRM|nr:CPBP family glutamic-type intramembrane protease [Natranaerovirga hydrolytica]TCK92564.1 membrane protease YdiL (CAAX protease family) [Natranaerovirga hydrolytica]
MTDNKNKKLQKAYSKESDSMSYPFSIKIVFMFIATIVLGVVIDLGETLLPQGDDWRLTFAARGVLATLLILPFLLFVERHFKHRNWKENSIFEIDWRFLVHGAMAWFIPASVIITISKVLGWSVFLADISLIELVTHTIIFVPLVIGAYVLPEELIFRGYIQKNLSKSLSVWPSIFLQAGLFTLWGQIVNGYFNGIGTLFIYGVFFGLLRNMTGNVWAGIGLRLAISTTFSLLGYMGYEMIGSMAGFLNTAIEILPLFATYFVISRLSRQKSNQLLNGELLKQVRSYHETKKINNDKGLTQKGISYDVGTSYVPGQSSRPNWYPEVMRREIQVIRDELHCNSILIFGNDLKRLVECAEEALKSGLYVWLQPRLMNSQQTEMISNLKEVSKAAEKLRQKYQNIGLNIGCELSFFTAGSIPGRDFSHRAKILGFLAPLLPLFNWRLNKLLRKAAAVARSHFNGSISYGAGTWEDVDWSQFDMIGLNYYLDSTNQTNYVNSLRKFYKYDKPIVITEFGCCSYEGAEFKGASGADIQDWMEINHRKLDGIYTRNEQVQADYIGSLINLYEQEGLYGAFVCMFIEGDSPYSEDPLYDLDRASFGIVKPYPLESGKLADEGYWQRKQAFYEIAQRYGSKD